MILKKSIIAIGLLALACGTPAALATSALVMTSLYVASFVPCDNSTSCHMFGDMAPYMYTNGAELQNGTKILPFEQCQMTDIKNGEAECAYATHGNWPSGVTFFSDGNVKLFPQTGNETGWIMGDDFAMCNAPAEKCPFTTTPTARL